MKLVNEHLRAITVLDHGETIAIGASAKSKPNPAVIEAYLGEPV